MLPEDCALGYIEGLLINCERDKCIAKTDDEGYLELIRQESKRKRIDWSKHAEIYLKGLEIVYKKLQQTDKKLEKNAAKRRQDMIKNEYSVLERYDFDSNQIHNAYGYEMIDIEEHDRLIKLLEQSEKTVALPEKEAVKYFTSILNDCKYEKLIAETKCAHSLNL